MPVNRPHDRLFRAVFGHAPEAAALLRAHLPETLARDLQWSSLTRQDATFVDDELRGSESDLLFSVEMKAGLTLSGALYDGLDWFCARGSPAARYGVLVYGGDRWFRRRGHMTRPWYACV